MPGFFALTLAEVKPPGTWLIPKVGSGGINRSLLSVIAVLRSTDPLSLMHRSAGLFVERRKSAAWLVASADVGKSTDYTSEAMLPLPLNSLLDAVFSGLRQLDSNNNGHERPDDRGVLLNVLVMLNSITGKI